MFCPECGYILNKTEEELTIVLNCEKCGYSVAATNTVLLERKNKKHDIFILNGNFQSIELIKLVSKIKNVNFIQARLLLKNTPQLYLISDNEENLQTVIKQLKQLNITYQIN